MCVQRIIGGKRIIAASWVAENKYEVIESAWPSQIWCHLPPDFRYESEVWFGRLAPRWHPSLLTLYQHFKQTLSRSWYFCSLSLIHVFSLCQRQNIIFYEVQGKWIILQCCVIIKFISRQIRLGCESYAVCSTGTQALEKSFLQIQIFCISLLKVCCCGFPIVVKIHEQLMLLVPSFHTRAQTHIHTLLRKWFDTIVGSVCMCGHHCLNIQIN